MKVDSYYESFIYDYNDEGEMFDDHVCGRRKLYTNYILKIVYFKAYSYIKSMNCDGKN